MIPVLLENGALLDQHSSKIVHMDFFARLVKKLASEKNVLQGLLLREIIWIQLISQAPVKVVQLDITALLVLRITPEHEKYLVLLERTHLNHPHFLISQLRGNALHVKPESIATNLRSL